MKTFIKWNGRRVEDYGAFMSDEAKSYTRAFRNFLRRNFLEAELVGFKPNHYDTSGFLVIDGVYVCVRMEVPRWGVKIDFSDEGFPGGILYRTAKDIHDFHGDANHFSSIFNLVEAINQLVARTKNGMRNGGANCGAKMVEPQESEDKG